MILYFLRHGESRNNILDSSNDRSTTRSSEPDLSDRGEQQALRTAGVFSRADGSVSLQEQYNPYRGEAFAVTHIYASPHLRALRTAAPIAERLDMPVHVYEDIHEAGGVFEHDREKGVYRGAPGLTRDDAERISDCIVYPGHLSESGWWNSRPLESEDERVERAARVRRDLVARHQPSDRVLFVSHTHFHVYFVCSILGLPYRDGYWITLNNCAITRFDLDRRGVRLEYVNRQDHLLPDLLG